MSESAKSSGSSLLNAIVAIFVIWLIFRGIDKAWHSKFRYSTQYSVSYDQVTVDKEPHNCDFLAAPIGEKNCHYDPQVQVIRTGHREGTTQRVVSYDDGKTWVEDTNVPPLSPSVYVAWEKIEE